MSKRVDIGRDRGRAQTDVHASEWVLERRARDIRAIRTQPARRGKCFVQACSGVSILRASAVCVVRLRHLGTAFKATAISTWTTRTRPATPPRPSSRTPHTTA
eukprot:2711128-Rhodomonas_salina.1